MRTSSLQALPNRKSVSQVHARVSRAKSLARVCADIPVRRYVNANVMLPPIAFLVAQDPAVFSERITQPFFQRASHRAYPYVRENVPKVWRTVLLK